MTIFKYIDDFGQECLVDLKEDDDILSLLEALVINKTPFICVSEIPNSIAKEIL